MLSELTINNTFSSQMIRMFSFQIHTALPVQGGRLFGGGLVEVEGRAVWGGQGGVYTLDEVDSQWKKVADGCEVGATLATCGGELVCIGGVRDEVCRKEVMVRRRGRWTSMSDMLVGSARSCAVSVSGGGLVIMGGEGDGLRYLNDVQFFDGRTWYLGPPLPQPCCAMSSVVHGDHIFVMGGRGMDRAVWSANITDLVSH